MQQREIVSGFTELKDLLIRTYKIDRDRALVKLYFSLEEDHLLMHDYSDHKKYLVLSRKMNLKEVRVGLTGYARLLVVKSLEQESPAVFLNEKFKLNGFFRF